MRWAFLFAGLVFLVRPLELRATEGGPYRDPMFRASLLAAEVDPSTHHEPERLVACLLALTLGPFGAHRLYLGTVPKVPIIYGVTFGGFGLLAVIDLGHLIFTKDLAPYRNSDRVFMWSGPPVPTTPP